MASRCPGLSDSGLFAPGRGSVGRCVVGLEDLADPFEQGPHLEWFLNEAREAATGEALDGRLLVVAAHQQDGEIRADKFHGSKRLDAVHVRHGQVEENEPDVGEALFEAVQAGHTVFGDNGIKADPGKDAAGGGPDRLLIIDDEDQAAALEPGRARLDRGDGFGGIFDARQQDFESGSLPRLAVDL